MTLIKTLDELFQRWQAARDTGRELAPQELCPDDPELAAALAERIRHNGAAQPQTVDFAGDAHQPTPLEPTGDFDHAAYRQETPQDPASFRTPLPQTADIDTGPDRLARVPKPLPASVSGGRYDILGELGRGGMGVVYRARDTRSGRIVALKTMQHQDGLALDFFKKEFRFLQGVSHPHLVQLYDLESDGQDWLLTMDLVEGVDFLSYVRPQGHLDVERLREALGQLVEGIAALHAYRRVHRDLKPHNVRVTPQGKVVVLDFGLAADIGPSGEHQQADRLVLGTVPYMAPEQGRQPPVSSAASDWYSVGVMLYQALTGRLPFVGPVVKVLKDKQLFDPPAPRAAWPDAPEDLNDLCMALLQREPEARPTAADLLARLGRQPLTPPVGAATVQEAPLLGRERHLRFLEDAYLTSRQGQTVMVAVSGPSGIGKSALLRHFLEGLRSSGVVVLAGRCYEHESVPYKALDPIVDELAGHLRSLPRFETEALLPPDVGPLVRIFPVLGSVDSIGRAAQTTPLLDPHEVRRQAFAALRELLTQVGRRRPLILHIDDLQWGDLDSAYLLSDLVRPPEPPPLLLVTSYRSEDVQSPCLKALDQSLGRDTAIDRRTLDVAPLTEAETQELVLQLLGEQAQDRAAQIARESGGNPFFITELIQASLAGTGIAAVAAEKISLERLIRTRAEQLPEGARQLLEVLAVSGRPLEELAACQAAGVGVDGRALLARLEAGRFIRGVGADQSGTLETYHDRIRETVVASLSPAIKQGHHRQLAVVLEATGHADPEAVAVHFEGAQENEKAGTYYEQAADRAAAALAFEQSATHYRKSLQLKPPIGQAAPAIHLKLADALAHAGRGGEAGTEYLNASTQQTNADAFQTRRKAADQFLLCGRTEEGLAILSELLQSVGLRFAGGKWRALLGFMRERLRRKLRGWRWQECAPMDVPASQLMRIDACETACHRLSMVDVAQNFYFMAKHIRLALEAGEPYRVANAHMYEAILTAAEGYSKLPLAVELCGQGKKIADKVADPELMVKGIMWGGYVAWAGGQWREALSQFTASLEAAAHHQVAHAVGLIKIQHGLLDCLMMLGRWQEMGHCLPSWLQDAQRRGDRFATCALHVHSYVPLLAAGKPEDAVQSILQGWEAWPHAGNVMGTLWSLYGRVEAALYTGNTKTAWELLRQERASLNRTTLYEFLALLNLIMVQLQGRTALAFAETSPGGGFFSQRNRLLRTVAKDIRRLEKGRMPWSNPLANLLRAGIAHIQGQPEKAVHLLAKAEVELHAADMEMYAAAARRQRGRLLGGDEGKSLIVSADAFMTGQEVKEPARIAAMLVPGFERLG